MALAAIEIHLSRRAVAARGTTPQALSRLKLPVAADYHSTPRARRDRRGGLTAAGPVVGGRWASAGVGRRRASALGTSAGVGTAGVGLGWWRAAAVGVVGAVSLTVNRQRPAREIFTACEREKSVKIDCQQSATHHTLTRVVIQNTSLASDFLTDYGRLRRLVLVR